MDKPAQPMTDPETVGMASTFQQDLSVLQSCDTPSDNNLRDCAADLRDEERHNQSTHNK